MLTKTLLFTTQFEDRMHNGKRVSGYLRAFNKQTGALLYEWPLDLAPSGVPMTYMHDGKQYVVLAAGGGAARQELIGFALAE